ncbi:unnamed protein product [Plutella xylostella]|uniref:(diamondback moth) hypothetical protein n=1 Tax=Plutella xylostella TaxID=51655 RepID=A0A8S4GAU8_PLUXY|nr:unnamed protein product [Plutella xylostella]
MESSSHGRVQRLATPEFRIIEALQYLHYTCRQIHRNICPQAIIVNKRGTWKLFGLEFYENIIGPDPTEMMAVTPWSMKVAKVAQPNLDYQAPEIQTNAHCNILSDMFSLGLVICACSTMASRSYKPATTPCCT